MAKALEQEDLLSVEASLSDGSDSLVPLTGVHRFVAYHLGYDLEIPVINQARYVALVAAIIVLLTSLLSILADWRILTTIGGLHKFVDSSAKVTENTLKGTSVFIDHSTGDVFSDVSKASTDAVEFISKVDEFSVGLPNIALYRQQLLDGDKTAWDTVMPQLQKTQTGPDGDVPLHPQPCRPSGADHRES